MTSDFEQRVARVAANRTSGASELLDESIAILRDALAAGCVPEVVRGLCLAQPAMAPLWNASPSAA